MDGPTETALKEAWAEFQENVQQDGAHASGVHVGTLEAMEFLREAADGTPQARRKDSLTPDQEEQGRFFDWLLHVKQDKPLAYEFLRREGTITVGPRQYWISDQGGRRAIAWESRYTYPGTDSEIWDIILVDD